jgi:hypothetical protein
VDVDTGVEDQVIRVVNENSAQLRIDETFERVPGVEFTRELNAVLGTDTDSERAVVVDRNASEKTKAAVNQALGFFRQNQSEQVNVRDDTSFQIIRVRLLQPERVNASAVTERRGFTGERAVSVTPEARNIIDRQVFADRTFVETSIVEDRQVRGFFREISDLLETEDRVVDTVTRVEFVDPEELNVSAIENRSFEGERTPEVILGAVDESDRAVDADREIVVRPVANASREGIGRFKAFDERVDVNTSQEETLIVVEFIEPEPLNVVERFERGLAELTRTPEAETDADAQDDRTVDVDREVDIFPRLNDSAEEQVIRIDRFNQAASTVFATNTDTRVEENVTQGLGNTDSVLTQAAVNRTFNQRLNQSQSLDTFLLARERFTQVSSQSVNVFQEFALGKDIVTGDFASVTPIVTRRDDQVIYTPINSDLPVQTVVGKEISADASQLGLGFLAIALLISYLGYDYYRLRKVVRLYKADRTGELTEEQQQKAERFIKARAGI